MLRRFVPLVLIAGFITLPSRVAFTQTSQLQVPTRAGQAPGIQPNRQTIQLNQQAMPLPAANGQPVKTPPTARDRLNAPDPLAPLNRKVLNVNVKVDRVAFHPLAGGWAKIVPKPARRCLARFFDNVKFIPRFTNDMLQLKLRDAGGELARFGINSTVGAAGLFDPAGGLVWD